MDLTKLLNQLQTVIDSEPTTTAAAARKLSTETAGILAPLREWAGELDTMLTDAEASATQLDDADDRNDREDVHNELISAVAGLREHLVPDPVTCA